jgi:ketosteroid isomerase-like protein
MTAQDVLDTYEKRINLHDFDALVDLIAPDATFWFSDGSHCGLSDVRVAFEKTWAALNKDTYWLTNKQWIASGSEVAVCVYCFNWSSFLSGKEISGSGRGTSVLRQSEGRWQIVHEHLSRASD